MGDLEKVFVQNIQRSLITFKEYQDNMRTELYIKLGAVRLKYTNLDESEENINNSD